MILEIDPKSVDSITDAINKLSKLRSKLIKTDPVTKISNVRYRKRMERIENDFDSILKIANANISSLYDNTGPKIYYVYVHCNPLVCLNIKDNPRHLYAATQLSLTSAPFYVGKGTGDRFNDLNRNEGHRKVRQFLKKKNKEIEVIKIKEELSEGEALALESKLIDIFGLNSISNRGLLVNLDEGHQATTRRTMYPKGTCHYLNNIKMQPYQN